jgi:hypothetical protein
MKISADSWHYRLYVFMSQWNAAWRHKIDPWEYPRGGHMIGLCPYMRMILIWGPLAILSNLLPLGALYVTFILFPVSMNGGLGVAWLLGFFVTVGAVVFAIGFIRHVIGKLEEGRRSSQITRQQEEELARQRGEEKTSFRSLVWGFLVAAKTKMCPVLELKNDD